MKQIIKNKYIIFFALFATSLIAWAATTGLGGLVANQSQQDNIIVIRKEVYAYPDGGLSLLGMQKTCTGLKQALFAQTGDAKYAPLPEDVSTLEDMRKLQDITITEYYSGNSYAKYINGFEFVQADWKMGDGKGDAPVNDSKYNCGFKTSLVKHVEISTPEKYILINTGSKDSESNVIYEKKSLTISKFKPPLRKLVKDLQTYKLPNSNRECLSKPGMVRCIFKEIPIHLGTDLEVVVHDFIPKSGEDSLWDSMMAIPEIFFSEDPIGTYTAKHSTKARENISIEVGKAISVKVFEMPDFAKNYPTKYK